MSDTDILDIDAVIESYHTEEPDNDGDGKPVPEKDGDDKGGEEKDGKEDGGSEADPEKEGEGDGEKTDDEKPKETDEKAKKGGEKEGAGDEPPAKPKKNRYQERLETIAADRARLRRELDDLKQEREAREPEMPAQPDPRQFYDQKGNFDQRNFDFATGKWQAQVDQIKEQSANKEKDRVAREQTEYFGKMRNEKSIYGDFDSAVRSLEHFTMTKELHEVLKYEDNATDLFCFLGSNIKNPEVIETLSLKGYQQTRKLAEIAIKLRNAAQRKKQTNAPAPPAKTPKGGGGAPKKDPSKMSAEEWAIFRGYKVKPKGG